MKIVVNLYRQSTGSIINVTVNVNNTDELEEKIAEEYPGWVIQGIVPA